MLVSFALPLIEATEAGFFVPGFTFSADLCNTQMDRTGLHWCYWCAEDAAVRSLADGKSSSKGDLIQGCICRDTRWKQTISMLHV